MATAFNPYGMHNITVIVHNADTKVIKFETKKEYPIDQYKQKLVNFLEEINKSYSLPTSVTDEATAYTSLTLQKIVELMKDDKNIKKKSGDSVDHTREYFINATEMV